jgi:uncharacterized protein YebE (UPF0316 family)
MILFFVGIIEMLIVTVWTKLVTKTKILASGIVTMVNVTIWYYVLQSVVDHINDWRIALFYALGCSLGTMLSTYYFQVTEKKTSDLSEIKH